MKIKCLKCQNELAKFSIFASMTFPGHCHQCKSVTYKKFILSKTLFFLSILTSPFLLLFFINTEIQIWLLTLGFTIIAFSALLIDMKFSKSYCITVEEFKKINKKKDRKLLIGLAIFIIFVYFSVTHK